MPKARAKKKQKQKQKEKDKNTESKSMFFYGSPNKEKLKMLMEIQRDFTDLVNTYISLLLNDKTNLFAIIMNNKKSGELRKFEKANRPGHYSSAYSQNAFDMAVTILSNRYDAIRIDMLAQGKTNMFILLKSLFAYSLLNKSKDEMEALMLDYSEASKKNKVFYESQANALHNMSDADFQLYMTEFHFLYANTSLMFRTPHVNKATVPLDSRVYRFEESINIKAEYVVYITDPREGNPRIAVPVNTSHHSRAILRNGEYKVASSANYSIINGKLKLSRAYKKSLAVCEYDNVIGADIGIRDCIHTSDGKAFGSFDNVIAFYKENVEPSFAALSNMRNKKRKISNYLRKHPNLPYDVRRSLIVKMDHLDQMIQKANAPYRKNRHYQQMLDHEIVESVNNFVRELIPGNHSAVAIELLDTKEFNKSKKANGKLSMFARGKLNDKLVSSMKWNGIPFIEVAPEFTSQVCPVCFNLDKKNRNGKNFLCTCCGYKDDADHVGGINIKARAENKELMELCDKNIHNHHNLRNSLVEYYAAIRTKYINEHTEASKTTQPITSVA